LTRRQLREPETPMGMDMTPRARHSTAILPFSALLAEEHHEDAHWPGERIGSPQSGTRGKALLRGAVVIVIVLGGGWVVLGGHASWPTWLTAAPSSWVDRKAPAPTAPAALPAKTSPPANAAPPTKAAALAPPPSTPPSLAWSNAAAAPAKSTVPPPAADPADADQMRAEAAGLHPGLSRVLLARLSQADYRNAGIAIQTALTETPDNAVYVWPRQRKPELALFKVHFVPGAAPDCRRYVVTVTKDGWLTTALPMEKCGPQPGRLQ
jgi:hypothetical protein